MNGPFIVPPFALPLHRARWAFVGPDLWRPMLHASNTFPEVMGPPPSTWRYEVFTAPRTIQRSDEGWASWANQNANPWVRSEVERQHCFYKVSLELGARLSRGSLKGFARVGSITGPWTEIPAPAWSELRAPYSGDYEAWRLGHLIGGGADLWDVQVLDSKGLPFAAAALAYGPSEAAQIVRRAAAFGLTTPATPKERRESQLDQRMASLMSSVVMPENAVSEEERAAAQIALEASLLERLKAGELIGERVDGAGVARPISTAEWAKLGRVIVNSKSDPPGLSDVVVRPSLDSTPPAKNAPARKRGRSQSRPRPLIETAYHQWAAQIASPPTKRDAEDWARAQGYPIGTIRELQREFVARRAGRPQKV